MRGGWHRQSMQGGLAAYGFIGNQGAQGLRAEHPWKGPRLSTKKPKVVFGLIIGISGLSA